MARHLLGNVAVDSAQLIIADPSYLNQWVRSSDVEPYALNCTGRDVSAIVAALEATGKVQRVEPMSGGRWFRLYPSSGETAITLLRTADQLKVDNGWTGATIPVAHDSYEAAGALTSGGLGGEMRFPRGTGSGFAVAVRLGGDGRYPLYLDVDGSGNPLRITIE